MRVTEDEKPHRAEEKEHKARGKHGDDPLGDAPAEDERIEREEEILAVEKAASELKRTYFGPQGELYKKRESLMAPIQEEIYNAVKDICELKKYTMFIDRSSAVSLIYSSPSIDISADVLNKLGYGD